MSWVCGSAKCSSLNAKDLFEEKANDLGLQVRLELPDFDPAEEADSLKNSVDIIRWYQHFIYVKLIRAVQGKLEETSEDFEEF
ncbi:unnamed protein product, partial [marine sediment metagenome]